MTLRAVIWCAVSTAEQTIDEKDSLPAQEREALALADREGWRVIEVLRVPGHSRRYVDIYECARDMAAQGIQAFNRLLQLWKARGFDVLVCRDGNRFARTQTLHSHVVERTIEIGARLYSLADGWVDENNYRMWIAMNGYKAASDIDWLVKARKMGMAKRMERGLSGGNGVPATYRVVRDETGKALRLEFREEYRRMCDDAAVLLLSGCGWKAFAIEMYQRFGYVNPKTGQPYHDNTFYRLFHNPIVWGISAKCFVDKYGVWAFDENEPLPPGVVVNRKPIPPIPPIWTGETAEQIKAELRRRAIVVRGRGRPDGKYKFTGLMACASCNRRLAVETHYRGLVYWRCPHHTYRNYRMGPLCENRRAIRDDKAQSQIHDFLQRMITLTRPDVAALASADVEDDTTARADDLRRDIDALRGEINTMIVAQSKAPGNVQDVYEAQITSASERLAILEWDLQRTQSQIESPSVIHARNTAYEDIVQSGLDRFWERAPHEINQILHGIMGRYRFIVRDSQIIDIRKSSG